MGVLEKNLGKRIQQLRKNADLTQEEVARKAGLDWKYLAAIENGRKSPSLAVIVRLMHALDVDPPDVFNFKLKGRRDRGDRSEEAIHALVRRMDAAEKRLVLNLIRGVIRSRGRDKK